MDTFLLPKGSLKSSFDAKGSSLNLSNANRAFPRKSEFISFSELEITFNLINTSSKDFDISTAILDITANTSHLGIKYLDYILLNIHEFIIIAEDLRETYCILDSELIYTKALSRLISINIFRQHLDYKYSLPDTLSRKYIDIKFQLIDYFKVEPKLLHSCAL